MRYDKKLGVYDIHCHFDEEQMQMIERLAKARSNRKEEQKVNKVIRDAVDYLYAAQFGDKPREGAARNDH